MAAAAEAGIPSSPSMVATEPGISVVLRKRPRLREETSEADVVDTTTGANTVKVKEPKLTVDGRRVVEGGTTYRFDHVFDESCSNARVYVQAVKPVIDQTRRGGSAVFFAFGQTGSGKTHTMMGSAQGDEHGLYALAAQDIIKQLRGMRLSVSFYEIYSGKLFDLLNGRSPVQTLEDETKNLNMVGLTEHPVTDHSALLELMNVGAAQRSSGSTHVNDRSSRSHAVLVFTVKPRRETRIFSRISFIDLAGSERAQDTLDLDKKTRAEGAEINKSLLALKECVRAMFERKKHIPFRGSKLTQVLRDSFSGNCSTVMIANVSPCLKHCDDTVNTLKYTDRIKEMNSAEAASGAAAGSAQSVEPDLCPKCGFPVLTDNPALHTCPKQYQACKFCKMEIVKSKLQRHLEECNEMPVSCADCGLKTTRGQMFGHHDKCPSKHTTCILCNKQVLKKQREIHVANECPEAEVACTHCRTKMPRKKLRLHIVHCPARQVPCSACGFLVKQANLKEHQVICTADRDSASGTMRRGGKPPPLTVPQTPSRLPPLAMSTTPSKAGQSPPKEMPPAKAERQAQPPGTPNTSRPQAKKTEASEPPPPATARTVKPKPKKSPHKATRRRSKDDTAAATPPAPSTTTLAASAPTAAAAAPVTPAKPKPKAASPRPGGACPHCNISPVDSAHSDTCAGLVDCPFRDAGCATRVAKAQLERHIGESVSTHLLLVHQHSLTVSRENTMLRQKLSHVEKQQEVLSGNGSFGNPNGSFGLPSPSRGGASEHESTRAATPPSKREAQLFSMSEKTSSRGRHRGPNVHSARR